MAKQTFTTGQVLTATQMNSLQSNDFNQTVSTKTDSYVLVVGDRGTRVVMNAATAKTITVNTGIFDAGDTVFIHNIGAGVVTVTAGTATVNTAQSLALNQWEGGTLYFTSASSAIFWGAGTGDISGVTAGTGISGGGSSGSVTITNSMATTIDAKGDLIVGTGADTFARLAVGANDLVLTAASGEATGLKWASAASGGMTLLSTTTLSGTTTTISSIDQSYVYLYILIYGMTASASFPAEVRPNGGANFSGVRMIGTSTNTIVNQANNTWINLNYTDNASSGGNNSHVITIHNYASTTRYKPIHSVGSWETPSATDRQQLGGTLTTNSAITSIDVNTGNAATFSGGTVKIYGVK